jgi:signal transduction histidine kinase
VTRRGARLRVVAAIALVLALLGANEVVAARERAGPDEPTVSRDVAPARSRLADALTAIERRCAAAADEALRRTADVVDQSELLTVLSDMPLPDGVGVFLEGADRRVLAWSGSTIDDSAFAAMPRTGDGTSLVETPASRRLAVRRVRASKGATAGAAVLAVCHAPYSENFPLRDRALTPSSIEREVAREFRVAEDVRVLPPDASEGEPLASAFGGVLARLDVRPVSAASWDDAVDDAAGARRTALLAALVLVVAVALGRETSKSQARPIGSLARAAIVLAARAALGLLPLSGDVDLGVFTDASRYAHPLPLDVAGSPLSLLLTCTAVCLAASCLRRAARDGPMRRGPFGRTLVAAVVAALACRAAMAWLVGDVVENSTVEFFSAETILPGAAAATLLAAVLAAGVAAAFVVEAAWTLVPPAERPSTPRALAATLVVAASLARPAGGAPHAVALAVAALAGTAAALAPSLLDAGTVARAAAAPLGVAVALFAPLAGELHRATQQAAELEAGERVSRTVPEERLFVGDVLDRAAREPRLAAALAAGKLPRDLALSLWAKSPLAGRSGGSSLDVFPNVGYGEHQGFSADLPPATWLPHVSLYPPPGEISQTPLPGRGPGADGRWIVGETMVVVDGHDAARLQVVLETRPPAPMLPELRVLGSSRAPAGREPPRLFTTRYATDGALVETDDPWRAAGAPLDPDLRRAAVDERRNLWKSAPLPDRELQVFVRPDLENGEIKGVHAFSYNTGGARQLLLDGTRAALCGALVSLAALLFTARSWARRARLRLAQRLVISYVVVAAIPLAVLGWANREIAQERADDATRRDLIEEMLLLRSALRGPIETDLADRAPTAAPFELRNIAYGIGRHANVFLGPRLVAASDQGLFDTELLPTRLPGAVYRDVVLFEQPFKETDASVGGYRFDVGYAPWRSASDGKVIGAVSVPLLNRRKLRDSELASAMTALLGIYLASLVAAVGVGTWLAGRLTKPLSDLTDAAKRVARGDVEHPVPGAGPDELGEVVAAFNQMQSDLGESRARLVKAEKESAWRDMARQVAHEVKNPLTPMRLAAEHMRRAWRDKVPHFDDVLERGVDLIVRQTESLQRIAGAFSDFARFPSRRRESVDVPAIVDEVLDLWHDAPGVEIRRTIERPTPSISADPDELRRVFGNLLKNAVEALEGRGGVVTATLVKDGGALVLTLADDGPGIPDEILPRLFEPYLSTKTKGTGLGLAIVKRAVDDLGGSIAVESRRGVGTIVTVRMPVATQT